MTSSAIDKELEIDKNTRKFTRILKFTKVFKINSKFIVSLSMVDELNIRLTDLRIESLKFNAKHPLLVLYTKAGLHELIICHVKLFKFCLFSSMPKMILNL